MDASSDPSALNHRQRSAHLEMMTDGTLDVLVVGGGVTGCGVALDAALRGLRVGLVEQRDYASGTSSRSSKMFHGGLRYLQHLEFGLVREALRERNLAMRALCPHLVRPIPFIYPLRHPMWERIYVGAGVFLYELLARMSASPLPWHRHLGRGGMARLSPSSVARGGILYWDAVVDDARHTMTVARTAAKHGALVANSARVVGMVTSPSRRVEAATVMDLERGRRLTIRTRSVVNATGVWTDDVEQMAGERHADVIASKGVHILVPRHRIDSATGLIIRTDTSVLFVIPWGDHWIVGTTDTPWTLGRAHPAASRSDIEYLIGRVNQALRQPIGTSDIVGVYAGLRPLLRGETEHTSKLSREHAVFDRGNGLVSVAGGKYTTYRVMAADAVDALAPHLGRALPDSPTAQVPLLGASPWSDDRLHSRYGSLAVEIAQLAEGHLGATVVPHSPYLLAEIHYAATHEGALHLDDVLTRRTRLSVETPDRGVDAAPAAADVMADVLGWDRRTRQREVDHYRARVDAELDSQAQPDDRTADAARMGAPDVRTGTSD